MFQLGRVDLSRNSNNDEELLKLNAILKSCAMSLVDVANVLDILLDSIAEINNDVKDIKLKVLKTSKRK